MRDDFSGAHLVIVRWFGTDTVAVSSDNKSAAMRKAWRLIDSMASDDPEYRREAWRVHSINGTVTSTTWIDHPNSSFRK